jgi:hypothetical protein
VLDFSNRADDVRFVLDEKDENYKGSLAYERAFDAFEEVVTHMTEIGKAPGKHASYGTRQSAPVTLRRIGMSLCLMGSTFAPDVQTHMQQDVTLTGTMTMILLGIRVWEQGQVGDEDEGFGRGSLLDTMQDLKEFADGEGR